MGYVLLHSPKEESGSHSCLVAEFLCILAGSAAQNGALRVLEAGSLWCLVGVVVVSGVRSFLVLSLLL